MGFLDKVERFLMNVSEKLDGITEELQEDVAKNNAQQEPKTEAKVPQQENVVEEKTVEVPVAEEENQIVPPMKVTDDCDYPTHMGGFPTVSEKVRDETLREWMMYFAEKGNPEFQQQLAIFYRDGIGGEVNNAKALEWFEKAGEQGDVISCHNCGVYYEDGHGTAINYDKAIYWYEKTIELGDFTVIEYLLPIYISIKNDITAAARVLEKAANLGDVNSMYQLGKYYEKGRGVEPNKEIAAEWWEKAAEAGHLDAIVDVMTYYFFDKDRDLRAVKWAEIGAMAGEPRAQYLFGVCYAMGLGGAKDDHEGVKWWKKAAEQGHLKSQCDLGRIYLYGDGTVVPKDSDIGIMWLRRAASEGFSEAIAELNKLGIRV